MTEMVIMLGAMSQSLVKELLEQWPDRQAVLADANCHDETLDLVAVHRWFQRNSIPVKHWRALIEGSNRRGLNVTAEDLLAAHATEPGEVRKKAALGNCSGGGLAEDAA